LGVPVVDQLGAPRDADFYLCGPPAFLNGLTAALKSWGVPATRIYTEIFGPVEAITPGIASAPGRSPHAPAGAAGAGPQVTFTRSGLTAAWSPNYQSLLELAEACDVPVKWACRTGVCHTCESALIGGRVKYRPDPLEPPAEGSVLICCSEPEGDVEVDL
jgi:ferredoxin